MTGSDEFIRQNFVSTAPIRGYVIDLPPVETSDPPAFDAEWSWIKAAAGRLVPGAIMTGQSPSLKELLNSLALDGAEWRELAAALPAAGPTAKGRIEVQLKSKGTEIGKRIDALLPVIASQIALNEQQSKSGPFNTDATIQPGSAASYNRPLSELRDRIHLLKTRIGIALLALD
ncbi:hypothetical protein [Nisaea sediminum]|uniref:hypothetical protein n=1 Tax=Nisaea sediminum TaxID=2775867 RepID=UPI001865A511|nr:hypothetical protein [Nisaea sediminum]